MTWPLAAFSILALTLVAGFAWYERSHPSSKVLALVATVAALAALGRIAFAPLPNVKPTTDIVLLAGYVLGGAPGFAIGAISALASNIVFGQGPWTPWQMGAWGFVGVMGAVLAATCGRDLGRWPLAIACMTAGFVYGAILDFSSWVTFSGSHTLDQLLAISATSLWFNVAHAVGNLVFCLAFGPVLVRALTRYRSRFDVVWKPLPVPAAGAAVAIAALVVALGVGGTAGTSPAHAATASASDAPSKTVRYLRRAQNDDGGFGASRKSSSSPLYSGWAVMGLAAAGRDPSRTRRDGNSATAYIERRISSVRSTGDLERTILALRAAGRGVRDVRGRDLVKDLLRKRDRNHSFDNLTNLTSFGVLALRAAGRSKKNLVVRRAARWIARQQNEDGGWGHGRRGGRSSIDDTAAAVQALVAAGRSRRKGAVADGIRYLERRQKPDGGFALGSASRSNAQSTAFAIQAFVAAKRNPSKVRRKGSRSPISYLRTLVQSDGSIRYSRTSRQDPVWVTAQAVAALERKALPIRAPR